MPTLIVPKAVRGGGGGLTNRCKMVHSESIWGWKTTIRLVMFSPVAIFTTGISMNEVVTSPVWTSSCVIIIGKDMSSSSLLPSVAKEYISLPATTSPLIVSIESAAIAYVICVYFVLAHKYCLAISLSGNIRLVSLEKWSLMASGKLCSVTKPWNNVSAWITDCAMLLLLLPEANIDRDWDVSTSFSIWFMFVCAYVPRNIT